MGSVYSINENEINSSDFNEISPKIISTNFESDKVLDILIHNKKLYISAANEIKGCKKIEIFVADLNLEKLNFRKIFSPNECGYIIFGGRMQFYIHDNSDGIIFTTFGHEYNKPDNTPQDDNSIYGKIIFLEFANKKPIIFSKGHRVSQGLYAEKNLILQTEHGPKGGDEINKIVFQKNYGWPISSYGEKYFVDYTDKPTYKKDHYDNNFEEPIYSFVKSVGISELVRLPNTFSKHFASQIASNIKSAKKTLITGGGAYNDYLIQNIINLTESEIIIPNSEIIEYKEALIFGFLGVLKDLNINNCYSSVTGAMKDHSSGNIFIPKI